MAYVETNPFVEIPAARGARFFCFDSRVDPHHPLFGEDFRSKCQKYLKERKIERTQYSGEKKRENIL